MSKHYDIVIVGGGLVGTSLALALAPLPLSIALVDARLPVANDPRLLALNYHSCQLLKQLAVWYELSAWACPIKQVNVSRQKQFGRLRLNANDINLPALGYVVPAAQLEKTLHHHLMQTSITCLQPATLIDLTQQGTVATLTIKQGEQIAQWQAGLVIGADGAHSTVRALAQIKTDEFDYQQSALVTQTTLLGPHQAIAYEHFTKQGVIAMLPLVGNKATPYRVATIWSGKTEHIQHLKQLSAADFLTALQQQFGYRLGKLAAIGERYTYPLQMVRAQAKHKQTVYLVGNAAHTLHPIAAQGFNLALYEVVHLIKAIHNLVADHKTVTAAAIAPAMASHQQEKISVTISHRLPLLFANETCFMNLALQLGMLGLDKITPAKRYFIQSILGRTGSLSRTLLDSAHHDSNNPF